MQLIIKYTVGDGCTYSCDVTLPVVCDSAEEFLVGFEEALKHARKAGTSFTYCNHEWSPSDFYWAYDSNNYELPNVMSVDEWFALCS